MRLIIGLGNPGKEYSSTRHNFGMMILDALADKKTLAWHSHKDSQSIVADFKSDNENYLLVKPQTFMNESGQAIRRLKSFYKIPNHKIIVIHDEISLPFGKIRLSKNRSSGGHKGIDSVIQHLKSKDFIRVRLGIGPQVGVAEDFVLQKFMPEEKNKLPEIIDTCHLILDDLIQKGFIATANKYN